MVKQKPKIAYLCGTAWSMDFAWGATEKFYPSAAAVKRHHGCTSDCGIARVKVTFEGWEVPRKPISEWKTYASREEWLASRAETSSTLDKRKRLRKLLLDESDPPNRGDNANRKPKHGAQKKRKPSRK